MSIDNIKLWNRLSKTDPKHTKTVEQGQRKFTAIDAHWQVQRMTEEFGPVGIGWGYEVAHSTIEFPQKDNSPLVLAVADVMLWTRHKGEIKAHYGPIRGTCEFRAQRRSGAWFTDEDAPKKATTDAMTKGLSHLGVSADVFLGKFDDVRYVAKVGREFDAEAAAKTALPASVQIVLDKIAASKTADELEKVVENARGGAGDWTQPHKDLVAMRITQKRRSFEQPAAQAAE